jgi:methionine-S-sulfoxide reductase
MKKVIFAGGCFWCVEADMKKAPGVIEVLSGYSGGDEGTATYDLVTSIKTGHREVVEVSYDESTTFTKVCQWFLDHIDPTDDGGQFGDRGDNYKTAIYYASDEEKKIAEGLLDELNKSGLYDVPVVVEVLPMKPFYKAEDYHQGYSEKNPFQYSAYRVGSGREDFITKTCRIREEKKMTWKETQ